MVAVLLDPNGYNYAARNTTITISGASPDATMQRWLTVRLESYPGVIGQEAVEN